MALRDAIAHRRHAAGNLRNTARLLRSLLDERREPLIRLMRGKHVVIGSDNSKIRNGTAVHRLLHMSRACGDPMGKIGASKSSTARLGVAQRVDAREIVLPREAAAQADAGRDIGDCGLHHVWLLSACRVLGRSLDLTRW